MLDRIKLISAIERDRRAVTRSATVAIYDMFLHYLADQADRSASIAPKARPGRYASTAGAAALDNVVSTGECPECARRRKAKAKAMQKWRRKAK